MLGTVEQRLGRPAEAVDCQLAALDLARRTGIRYSAVEALIGLATVRGSAVDARQALDLARTAGYRALEGRALTTLARLPADRGRALEHARRALEVHRRKRVTASTKPAPSFCLPIWPRRTATLLPQSLGVHVRKALSNSWASRRFEACGRGAGPS